MNPDLLTVAAVDRVNESKTGWLTTLRVDGSPHTTPVWFVYESNFIWVATGVGNVKVRNARNDPRVSFAIDGTADSPLVAQGNVDLITPQQAGSLVLGAFERKYDGWDIQDDSIDGERVVITIHVSRWLLIG